MALRVHRHVFRTAQAVSADSIQIGRRGAVVACDRIRVGLSDHDIGRVAIDE
jgi:hypothetical protein